MRIAQFKEDGFVRVGLVENDRLIPLDFSGDMMDLIMRGGVEGIPLRSPRPLRDIKLIAVVSRPSKIIAIGLNYQDHVREGKMKVPEVPVLFSKFPSSLLGHGEKITWSRSVSQQVDFEAELAVIMGKEARDVREEDALGTVFGYTCGNDVSARDLQFGDGQWVRGKSLDTFCPLGPWIVTPQEIPDPHCLGIKSLVNGVTMQSSSTAELIFNVPFLISFLSRHFTLLPGDVILTGTPMGVGAFREPPQYLKNGDEIVVEIERIGRLVNTCLVF